MSTTVPSTNSSLEIYNQTKHAPAAAPAAIVRMVFTLNDSAAAMWSSEGPSAPPALDAPGLGAPPGASPPPSTLWVAVGRGE